jgi:Secretion system C-terminal sorting domain
MFQKPRFFTNAFLPKVKLCLLFILFVGVSAVTTFAQTGLTVSFPTNRIVFQRNNENFGFVNIVGSYTQTIDKVEAKLTPIIAGQGTATDWELVQGKVKAGYFTGKIKGQGGWYKLDVRAVKDNIVLQTVSIEKVGIGEVFIALGQSNAQGIPNYGAKGATDDRVNTINFQNSDVLDPLPENLNFVQLSDNVNVAPQGDGPWCYGELGDRLVKRLNVPVAFFNEGLLLVSVINWRESAEGQPTFNFVLDVGGRFQLPKGLPYINLKNTLQYYASLMGVRSLLWIQGETDNSPNRLSADVYANHLQRVIDISRADFDENLTWVVARTSLTYLAPSNPEIIGGQNRIINKAGNNVFAGPFTDNLQVPRFDNVHFQNVPGNMGISLLAENWDKSLDDNFFQNSKPILAKSIIEPEIACDNNNQVSIKLPAGLKSYEWSNNAKINQVTVDKGVFSVAVKDPKGNKILVPTINTNLLFPNEKPVITADKSLEFCTDGTSKIELTANGQEFKSFQWSSGETVQKISLVNSGEFTVKGKNEFGCVSVVSDKAVVKANPSPAQPKIVVSPANNVCIGKAITLSTDSSDKLSWSNSDTTKTLKLENLGNYEFSVKATNKFGCISATSDNVLVKISPIPEPPKIVVSPANNVCIGKAITLSTDSNDELSWSNSDTTKTLKIENLGNYEFSVKVTNKFGCISATSDKVLVKINPIPEPPKVVVSPANNVCEGQTISLSIDSKDKILWNNSDTTKVIKIEKLGSYELSAKINNDFGCVSAPSVLQKLNINPSPKQPSIAQIGLFSLQAQNGDFFAKDKFEWKRENTILSTTNVPTLKVTQSGNYKVSTIRVYKMSDNQEFSCYSKLSEPISFQISDNIISLYPNPATDLIYLETKDVIRNLEVKFYTLSGKQVFNFRLDDTSERKEIDVRSLEKGTYIVSVKGDGFEESKRLIIQSK